MVASITIMVFNIIALIIMGAIRGTTIEEKEEECYTNLGQGLIILHQIEVLEFLVLQDHFKVTAQAIHLKYQFPKYVIKEAMW